MVKKCSNIYIVLVILILHALVVGCANKLNSSTQIQSKNYSKSKSKLHVNMVSLQEDFLIKLNKIRAVGRNCGDMYYPAAPPLVINNRLVEAAKNHSLDMSKHNFIGHISTNGDSLVERLAKVNYAWRAIGENVAHNQRNIDEVLGDWLSSAGHCSNMMSIEYNQTGVAQQNWYWTQVYAAPIIKN